MELEDLMEKVLAVEYPDELEVILKRALEDAYDEGAHDTAEDFRNGRRLL